MSLTPDLSDVASIPDDVVVRRMVALFDYDPWESSPNMDSEVSTIMAHELRYVFTTIYELSLSLVSNTTKWFVVMSQNIIAFPLFSSQRLNSDFVQETSYTC